MSLNKKEQKIIKENGKILKEILNKLKKKTKLGVKEKEVESLAEKLLKKHQAKPAFLNYPSGPEPYPAITCISVNDEVVHSPPNDNEFKEDDLVSIDMGLVKNGLYSDSCLSINLGKNNQKNQRLMKATKTALDQAAKTAKAGTAVGDIGYVIEKTAQKFQAKVVKDLTGHGIGKELHQDPIIDNYGSRGQGERLKENTAIAIEPILTFGQGEIKQGQLGLDPYTIYSRDHEKTCHFENCYLVKKTGLKLLT